MGKSRRWLTSHGLVYTNSQPACMLYGSRVLTRLQSGHRRHRDFEKSGSQSQTQMAHLGTKSRIQPVSIPCSPGVLPIIPPCCAPETGNDLQFQGHGHGFQLPACTLPRKSASVFVPGCPRSLPSSSLTSPVRVLCLPSLWLSVKVEMAEVFGLSCPQRS